jgi:anion-transporting  ArsA/GET3 family ATPase
VRARLQDKRVVICAGSGGVGKTTTSAALAMGLAAEGKRVAVVTIDPARRLANALGLDDLGNEPHLVDPARLAGHGIEVRGELWAMMLDAKRTFDELITRLAPDERSRDDVLSNRIYQQLSGAVAGSQEFTAVAKLYELDRSGRFDVLVLDTPPSRNALDFLDAPERLTGFFEGRALRVFLAPTGLAARVVGRGTSVVFSVLKRLTGVDLLDDLAVFFRALGGLIEGFKERAAGVKALLEDERTTFIVITSPEREPVEEAIFFTGKLRDAGASSSIASTRSTAARRRPTSTPCSEPSATPSWPPRSRAPTPRSAHWPSATRPRSTTSARRPARRTRSSSRSSTATCMTSTAWSPSTPTCSRTRGCRTSGARRARRHGPRARTRRRCGRRARPCGRPRALRCRAGRGARWPPVR